MMYQRCPKRGEDSEAHPLRLGALGGGCFRCAVDFVIARFGGDPNCECRKSRGPFCVKCEVRADSWNENGDSPLWAFYRAMPPYDDLARMYAGLAGSYAEAAEEGIILLKKDRVAGAARLLKAAETDPLAYDAALHFVAGAVRYGHDLPSVMREWGYRAITGQITRPPQKGKYAVARIDRDAAIVELVKDVCRLVGLRPTSSREDAGQSACHAVAEGLRLLKLQPDSYPAIKRAWLKRGHTGDVPAFVR